MILGIIGLTIGALGFIFGLRCYYELWKWARICQSSRIAIAYKRKVKLQAPLTEFIAWIKMLDSDQASQGRIIYSIGGTSVAITRADALVSVRFRKWIRIQKATRRNKKNPPKGSVKQGVWAASDETPKENHRATA